MSYICRRTGGLIRFSVLLTSLTSLTLLCVGAKGQVCDPLRWGNASAWKGTFSVAGNASGQAPKTGRCTTTTTFSETVTGKPVLSTGTFPEWFGTMNAQPSIREKDTTVCPAPFPSTCTNTISGNSEGGGVDNNIFLNIDVSSCTYSILPVPFANVTLNGCDGSVTQSTFPWGPLFGPDGNPVVGLPANNLTNSGVIPLPATGVELSDTIPPFMSLPLLIPATWNISWKLSPKCKVKLPDVFGQGNHPWDGTNYDEYPGETIGSKGCALTSLTMALIFAGLDLMPNGFPPNPTNVNDFMNDHSGDFTDHIVSWSNTVKDISYAAFGKGKHLIWNDLGGFTDSFPNDLQAKQKLDDALCRQPPHPVIVGVKHCVDKHGNPQFPCHFVVVTGRDEDGNYTIADPATGGERSLAAYGDFTTRGTVMDPITDVSGLNVDSGRNAALLVTDSAGRRTGRDPVSGNSLQEIAGSAYFVDHLEDSLTSNVASDTANMIVIPTAEEGMFTIVAYGVNTGPSNILIRAFSQDGSPQPPIMFSGKAEPGSTSTYLVRYTSVTGTSTVVTPLPGDRNGDGVVNCVDVDIVKASFGKRLGQAGFDPRADANADGVVDVIDLATVAKELPTGTHCK